MKIPRSVYGVDLVKSLRVLGYERIRQEGFHIRVTTQRDGEFHLTIPNHSPMRIGTLSSILKLAAAHHDLTVEELLRKFGL